MALSLAVWSICLLTGLAGLVPPVRAQTAPDAGRQYLGRATLVTNDSLGDLRDRWRTGGVQGSLIWGPVWQGRAPGVAGRMIELRWGAQVIAPASLTRPDPRDRPYAGALSLGLHTHFARGGFDMALGADLVMTGPQTGLDGLQAALHDLAGISPPSAVVRGAQIANGLHPPLVFEAGRDLRLGENATLRPFVEARWGDETLIRLGGDLMLGTAGQGGLPIRDAVSGHRYAGVRGTGRGLALVVGADVAHVADSIYLPAVRGLVPSDTRARVRLGLHHQGRRASVFYGVTWLGTEFAAQPEGQAVGSLRLQFDF